MDKRILIGIIAGILFGIGQKFLLGGGWDLLISGGLLGALIGFVSTKVASFGIVAVGAGVGALVFALSALATNMLVMDHTIVGAITGLIIGLIIKFVPMPVK